MPSRSRAHAAGLPLASIRSRQRRRSLLADPAWLRCQHVDERLSAWAIGQELEVADNTVASALRRHGLSRLQRPHRPGGIDPEWLLRRDVDDGWMVVGIAREAGVARTTVHRALVAHGFARTQRSFDKIE